MFVVQGEDDVTFLPGFCDDISCRSAHHLGNIQWTVNLLGNGDSPVHRLRFNLKHTTTTHTQLRYTTTHFICAGNLLQRVQQC